MSAAFLYSIAVMYLGAGISFAYQGKLEWAGLSFSWAIGNFLIGFISQRA